MLCFFLEEDMLVGAQRVIAIYLLFEMYKNSGDNMMTTPFYSILLKQCEDSEEKSRAEMKILSDYIISVPSLKKVIDEWIIEVENSDEPIEIPDASNYCQGHFENMPQGDGFEKGALHPVIREDDEPIKLKPKEEGNKDRQVSVPQV